MKISTKVNENLELNSDSIYIKGIGGYDGTNPTSASTIQEVIGDIETLLSQI